MNRCCSFEDYIVNPDSWNFQPQMDFPINQMDFVELANVQENIPMAGNGSLLEDVSYSSHGTKFEQKDLFIPNVHSPKYQW